MNRTLALSIAAAMLFVVANWIPLLSLSVVGRQASTTVLGAVIHLWEDGRLTVAVLVLMTAFVAPLIQIFFLLLLALAARSQRIPNWVSGPLRHLSRTRTWSMVEVMMLGVLVALIKIADYATVIPGLALFTLAGLIVVFAAMQTTFDPNDVWQRLEWISDADRRSGIVGDFPGTQ